MKDCKCLFKKEENNWNSLCRFHNFFRCSELESRTLLSIYFFIRKNCNSVKFGF
jgi:hypothetical protein